MRYGETINIKPGSKLHERIVNAVRDRVQASKHNRADRAEQWDRAEEATVAYLPETEVNRLRRAERESGKPRYTTIKLPYTFAVLMSAHTYWTSTFLSRNPILQYSGRHGEAEHQVQGVEALMDYQRQMAEMVPVWTIWLYDVGKYGVGICGEYWCETYKNVTTFKKEPATFGGIPIVGRKEKKVKVTERLPGYKGNKIYNIRPRDFFNDPRVPLWKFQEGEFCAVMLPAVSFNTLIRGEKNGTYQNIERLRLATTERRKKAKENGARGSNTGGGFGTNTGTSAREAGSPVIQLPDPKVFGSGSTTHSLAADTVPLYECYIELIPDEWKLGKSDFPEKWVFTVDEYFEVCIGASPLGYIHDEFPFSVITSDFDAYSALPTTISHTIESIQNTLDWLVNSHFYNVRSALNNRWIADPRHVYMEDVNSNTPGGAIRMRPSLTPRKIDDILRQVPVQDVTRSHLVDMQMIQQFGERATGINDSVMGMSNPKSRRSATEVRGDNTFAINRLKTLAEWFSATGFSQQSQRMLQNTQQLYEGELKFRIVGDLAIYYDDPYMTVTPEDISGFYDYVTVDGTLPVDRFAQANLWKELMTNAMRIPQVAQRYDLGKIFAFVAQLAGLKNIHKFEIQIMPDGTAMDQMQAGNIVPMPGGGNPEQPPMPRQPSGVGPVG